MLKIVNFVLKIFCIF